MKAFRFRLERLLGLAAADRREQARRLGEAQETLQLREAEAQAAAAGLGRAQAEMQRALGTSLRFATWREREADLQAGRGTEQRTAGRLSEQREHVAERQADYVGARREERLLQAMRDRQYRRWQTETGRREQAAMDDLAQVARDFRLRRDDGRERR